MRKIILGTRKSPLALAQTKIIQDLLLPYISIEIKTITTEGDRNLDAHYKNSPVSLKGFFTKEIEQALLNKEIDIAIHSAKDLPAIMLDGLIISAYSNREDARDVLISKNNLSLSELSEGAIVGTSSIRREKQLQRLRPDLNFKPIRGNIDTRINKLFNEEYDAIILAAAGLKRLNMQDQITEYFSVNDIIPAPAQGILALQCREADLFVHKLCVHVNNSSSVLTTEIERGFSKIYGGGCSSPLACYANVSDSQIHVLAMLEINNKIEFINKSYTKQSPDEIIYQLKSYMEEQW